MKTATALKLDSPTLDKVDPTATAFVATGRTGLAVANGFSFGQFTAAPDMPVALPVTLIAGTDYLVYLIGDKLAASPKAEIALPETSVIGGFHFAPGGNASARAGGDDEPAINPCSIWDRNFRPACADPSGMALVDHRFWADIYLLNSKPDESGTSCYGAEIADGYKARPTFQNTKVKALDFKTAMAIYAAHGKQLLSVTEYFDAAFGVTEKTAAGDEPELCRLDAPRTSKWGLMQATGNMWVWGHDGDPDEPRACIFGGSWLGGGYAGSRRASLDCWAELSNDRIGARGRSDHLQLA